MSSLQIGLIVFGVLLLLGMLAYNSWHTRRNTPRPAQPEDGGEEAVEPTWDLSAPAAGAPPAGVPVLGSERSLDALIDAIAPIALDGQVSGDILLAALPATRRVGSKPFAVQARPVDEQAWEWPLAGRHYDRLQVGVQLANRTGALTEIEYSEFVVIARHYADAVGGEAQFPDMMDEVARGRELDHFARAHDAELNLMVCSHRVRWSVGYVLQKARQLGFVAGSTLDRMALPSATPQQPPLLQLSFDVAAGHDGDVAQQAVDVVTLGFDVPAVLRSEQPWPRLHELAFALADAMGGRVVDGGEQPLREDALQRIGADLERLYDALEAHGLPAGAPQTRRLFG